MKGPASWGVVRNAIVRMAGMPLFAHVGREKLTPPPLSVPLELIKFCGSKPPTPPLKVLRLRRRTGLVFACFAPQNRKNAREAAVLSAFCGFAYVFGVSAKY